MIANQDRRRVTAIRNRMIALLVLVALCCFTVFAVAESSYTVTIIADGSSTTVKTSEREADAILEEAEIEVGVNDAVNLDSFEAGSDAEDGNQIQVYRGQNVTIFDGVDKVGTFTVAGTVQDALDQAGVTLRSHDVINVPVDSELTKDTTLVIVRAYTIEITVDGNTKEILFQSGTVADILDKAGIVLGENDETEPSLDSTLKLGQSIVVHRVEYTTREADEVLEYDTVEKSSSSLASGTTKVTVAGVNGTQHVVYKDKVVDGEVESSEVVETTVTKEAVNQVVLVGTKVSVSSSSSTGYISNFALPSKYQLSGGVPTNAVATITGQSTAYVGGGKTTSTGKKSQPGYVAVDPNEIPYGTEMYIVSADGKKVYGYAIAADTGGFTSNSSTVVDLCMSSNSQAVNWGRRNVVIYILSWG